VTEPTIVPTSAAVLSVLLPPFEAAEELVAGDDEVCVAESWALLFVVVGVLLLLPLPLPLPVLVLVLVGREYAVSEGIENEYAVAVAVGNIIDVPEISGVPPLPYVTKSCASTAGGLPFALQLDSCF